MSWTRREFVVRTTGGLAIAAWADNPFSWHRRLRVGLIGLGDRGVRHLSAGLRDDVEIAALCDTVTDTLAVAHRSHQEWTGKKARCTLDYHDLLTDASIDVVVVALPQRLQYEVIDLAVRHQKHVISLHPWAFDKDESEALVAAAEAHSRLIWLAPHEEAWPFEAIENLLAHARSTDDAVLSAVWTGTRDTHTTQNSIQPWTDLLASVAAASESGAPDAEAFQARGPAGLYREINLTIPDAPISTVRLISHAGGALESDEWQLTLRSRNATRTLWLSSHQSTSAKPTRTSLASWSRFLTQLHSNADAWRTTTRRAHCAFLWTHAAAQALAAARG